MATSTRHSWARDSGRRSCTKCGMQELNRFQCGHWWQAVYKQGDRLAIASRVPACGQELPRQASAAELRQLATEADRIAGLYYRSGDLQGAQRLLADCMVIDPSRSELWDQRQAQIAAKARQVQSAEHEMSLDQRIAEAGRQYPDELQRWAHHNNEVYLHELELDR